MGPVDDADVADRHSEEWSWVATPVDRPEFQRYWVEDCPQQRFALPEEIAPSVVFLASDAASFITGSILVADGGYTAV